MTSPNEEAEARTLSQSSPVDEPYRVLTFAQAPDPDQWHFDATPNNALRPGNMPDVPSVGNVPRR